MRNMADGGTGRTMRWIPGSGNEEWPMLARVISRTLDGLLVDVELDTSGSIPGLIVVGLPDAAIKESRERVRSAIPSSWTRWR